MTTRLFFHRLTKLLTPLVTRILLRILVPSQVMLGGICLTHLFLVMSSHGILELTITIPKDVPHNTLPSPPRLRLILCPSLRKLHSKIPNTTNQRLFPYHPSITLPHHSLTAMEAPTLDHTRCPLSQTQWVPCTLHLLTPFRTPTVMQ